MSIRDNIAYGRLWDAPSQKDVEEAARAANAHDFVMALAQVVVLEHSPWF